MNIIILLLMFYCHRLEDYYLQGILADFKQKSWWKEHYPDPLYKKDWISALITHSFSWSIFIMIPIFWYGYINGVIADFKFNILCLVVVLINTIIHSIVDTLKANERRISLSADQNIHMLQVFFTWAIVFLCMNF